MPARQASHTAHPSTSTLTPKLRLTTVQRSASERSKHAFAQAHSVGNNVSTLALCHTLWGGLMLTANASITFDRSNLSLLRCSNSTAKPKPFSASATGQHDPPFDDCDLSAVPASSLIFSTHACRTAPRTHIPDMQLTCPRHLCIRL